LVVGFARDCAGEGFGNFARKLFESFRSQSPFFSGSFEMFARLAGCFYDSLARRAGRVREGLTGLSEGAVFDIGRRE
jgi:hypothetical protein